MATATTIASGNESAAGTWFGGAFPGTSDDIVVASGHTLTFDRNITFGSAPDNVTTYAIDCASGASVTVAAGVVVTCKGNGRSVGGANCRFTAGAGSRWIFDTAARTSGTKTYRWLASSTEWTWYLRGTDRNNLASIEADSGGYFYIERTAGGARLNVIDCVYWRLYRMWDGTTGASALGMRVNRNAAGAAVTSDYLVMDTCGGPIILTDTGSGRTYSFDRVFVKNGTAGFYGISVGGFGASNTGTITRSSIDRSPNVQAHIGTTCTETYFPTCPGHFYLGTGSIYNTVGSNNSGSGGDTGILVSGAQNATASAKRQVVFMRGSTATNEHLAGITSSTAAITATIDGVIVGSACTSTNGDGYGAGTTGAGSKTVLQNSIFLANSNGGQTVNAIALLGGANSSVEIDHISFVTSNGAPNGVSVGETYTGHAGMVAKFKHSQAFDAAVNPPTGGSASPLFTNQETTATAQKFNAANMGDNQGDSAACTSDALAYDLGGTQDTPAIASYYGSLGLVDRYRTIADWAGWWGARVGAAGDGSTTPNADATYANAHLLLAQTYELELYTGNDMHELFWQYLARGHAPTVAAVKDAGDDGLTRTPYGMWVPAVTIDTVSASGLTATTNDSTGDYYVVLVPDGDQPDWFQDVIDGLDGSLAAVPAANIFTGAVSGTTISCTFTGADLGGGDYRAVLVHVRDAPAADPTQEVWARASEPAVSATFQAAAASSSDSGLSRPVFGMRGGKRVLLKRVRPTITAQAA